MWALVKDSVIANTIELSNPADFTPPAGYALFEFAECGIGWAVVDGVAVRPPDPEPGEEAILRQAKTYLASTDWYYTRMLETGRTVPDEVVSKRQAARELLQTV